MAIKCPGMGQKVKIYCGNPIHGDALIPMTLHAGAPGNDDFFSCPEYYGEDKCMNRFSITDYEKILNKLSTLAYDSEAEVTDLTGTGFRLGKLEVFVIEHDIYNDLFKVTVMNSTRKR